MTPRQLLGIRIPGLLMPAGWKRPRGLTLWSLHMSRLLPRLPRERVPKCGVLLVPFGALRGHTPFRIALLCRCRESLRSLVRQRLSVKLVVAAHRRLALTPLLSVMSLRLHLVRYGPAASPNTRRSLHCHAFSLDRDIASRDGNRIVLRLLRLLRLPGLLRSGLAEAVRCIRRPARRWPSTTWHRIAGWLPPSQVRLALALTSKVVRV